MIYEPREDSYLLEKFVKQLAFGSVLDIGTGSGIQAKAAAKKKSVKKILAVDVQKDVIAHCKKIKNMKITCKQSNLFSKVTGKFDTIIFNPPYLPADATLGDLTVEGGKKAYEIVQKFLSKAGKHLKDDGIILLLVSSLTNYHECEKAMRENAFDYKRIGAEHIFFEDLFVYEIKRFPVLKKLKDVKDLAYFSHGKRGIIFTGTFKGKKVAIKAKLPESKAMGRIEHEAKALGLMNKKKIGPTLIKTGKDFFVYRFVAGEFFPAWAEKAKKKELVNCIKDIFKQCYEMDIMGVDKEEMHHPYKHIVVDKKGKPVMLDFERLHHTLKPKNVTQFVQYLTSSLLTPILQKKGIKIDKKKARIAAAQYKKTKQFQELLRLVR